MTETRSRLDKLGVKADSRVAVLGVKDRSFLVELKGRTRDVTTARAKKGSDIVLLGAENRKALGRLRALVRTIKRNGTIWVVWPKGQQHIRQADVMAAAKRAGLVDVKIVAFSDTHSGLKLVIPVARRQTG
jgi:hypothetical protein